MKNREGNLSIVEIVEFVFDVCDVSKTFRSINPMSFLQLYKLTQSYVYFVKKSDENICDEVTNII